MPRRIRVGRRTRDQIQADERAREVATALGRALRMARRRQGLRQTQVARAAGVAQSTVSTVERGGGSTVSLIVWARIAQASGTVLHAYMERASSAAEPRDAVHLRTQESIARMALGGGWTSTAEVAIDDAARGSRSLDLWLQRQRAGRPHVIEVAAIEIFDWLDDVGAALRDWDRRLAAVDRLAVARLALDDIESGGIVVPSVSGCWVLRSTRRNRQLVEEHATLFRSKFPADGRTWLAAIQGDGAMPLASAILWATVSGGRIFAARSPRIRELT